MNRKMENRKSQLRQIAASDEQYQTCYREFLKVEMDFFDLLLELTEQQDRPWMFVNLSNEVDERLLEIACEHF